MQLNETESKILKKYFISVQVLRIFQARGRIVLDKMTRHRPVTYCDLGNHWYPFPCPETTFFVGVPTKDSEGSVFWVDVAACLDCIKLAIIDGELNPSLDEDVREVFSDMHGFYKEAAVISYAENLDV